MTPNRAISAAVALGLAIPYVFLPVTITAQSRRDPARLIEARDRRENGITVTEPRVFDDAQLQQRLQELEAQLARLQVIEQTGLTSRFGTFAGADSRTSSVGFNVQGPPIPGVSTITKLPTEQTKTTSAGVETTTTLATEDVTTTVPQFGPPPATAPAASVNMPSSFSVSASDVLDEMMQLQAEINGLRLLLSGDLSSHYVRGGPGVGNEMTKFKTTLGFNISVKPDGIDDRYKDAVAIVEVEVENVCDTLSNEPPAITALLPREKTYNVAEITENSSAISAGVATQIVGFSGSWVRGHKTHYLVRDQDTIALTFTPEEQPDSVSLCTDAERGRWHKKRVGFLWQFRPVLGRRYVRIAEKTTFVQLAFPVPPNAGDKGEFNEIGRVTVRSYWRGYDRKRRVHKEVISGSVREQIVNFDIPRYDLAVGSGVFNFRDSIEDLGGGQVLVKLPGRFLPGTNVRIGPTILAEGDRFKHRYSGIRFVASLSDLVTKKVFLVGHDGAEVPLTISPISCSQADPLRILSAPTVSAVDETNSRVTVRINRPELANVKTEDWLNPRSPIVFVVGQRVFGFPDAPIQRNGDDLSFLAPTALLGANPEVTVQTLFAPRHCLASSPIASLLPPPNQTERLVLLEQGDPIVKFLLYGTRLRDLTVIAPAANLTALPNNNDRILLVEIDARHLKTHKNLLFQRPNDERPFLIPIPSLEAPKKPDPPKAAERITVDADEAVIVGEGLKDVAKVFFRRTQLDPSQIEPADDGKSLRLTGLARLGVTRTAATQPIILEFKSGAKVVINVEVVDSKIESVPR